MFCCSTHLCLKCMPVLVTQNAVLQREREVLVSQLTQSQSACAQLREQLDTLQRHSISLQENGAKLQALNTKLQVSA